MKLSEDTLNILKNFSTVNQSISVQPGNIIRTLSNSKTSAAVAQVSDEFDTAFHIYELGKFLACLGMFDDADVEFHSDHAVISSGKQSVSYRYADPDLITTLPTDPQISDAEFTFNMSASELQSVMKAAGILGSPEILIQAKDGTVELKCVNSKDDSSNTFSIDVGETDKDFSVYIKTENLKLIQQDYTVQVAKDSTRFVHKVEDETMLTYWAAIEHNSEFN